MKDLIVLILTRLVDFFKLKDAGWWVFVQAVLASLLFSADQFAEILTLPETVATVVEYLSLLFMALFGSRTTTRLKEAEPTGE